MNNPIETYLLESPSQVRELTSRSNLAFIIVFFGSDFDYVSLYHELKKSKLPFIGCMDTGRLFNDKYRLDSNTAVAMLFSKEIIEKVKIVSYDMRLSNSYQSIHFSSQEQYKSLFEKMQINPSNPNLEREFAINLLFGLQSANPVLQGQSEVSIFFQTIGGSAGGKLDFKHAPVICSKGYGNIGTTAMIRLKENYYFLSDINTSFQKTEHKLKVTKLNSPRHIREFNEKPAQEEYARILNLSLADLGPHVFAKYALGLETGDGERLITSIQGSDKQGGLFTYNDVLEGVSFNIYEAISQYEPRKHKFQSLLQAEVVGIISFDCVLCYLARNSLNEVERIASLYQEVFPFVPKIGFGTFSENFCGANVNQTETMIAFLKKGGS